MRSAPNGIAEQEWQRSATPVNHRFEMIETRNPEGMLAFSVADTPKLGDARA